jgi:Domain of unknown function (DUF4407)
MLKQTQLAFAAGFDPLVLAKCPANEIGRAGNLGALMIIMYLVNSAIWSVAFRTFEGLQSQQIYIFCGCAISGVIILIDRSFIMADLARQVGQWQSFVRIVTTVPRVALAFFFGLSSTRAAELVIFIEPIKVQIESEVQTFNKNALKSIEEVVKIEEQLINDQIKVYRDDAILHRNNQNLIAQELPPQASAAQQLLAQERATQEKIEADAKAKLPQAEERLRSTEDEIVTHRKEISEAAEQINRLNCSMMKSSTRFRPQAGEAMPAQNCLPADGQTLPPRASPNETQLYLRLRTERDKIVRQKRDDETQVVSLLGTRRQQLADEARLKSERTAAQLILAGLPDRITELRNAELLQWSGPRTIRFEAAKGLLKTAEDAAELLVKNKLTRLDVAANRERTRLRQAGLFKDVNILVNSLPERYRAYEALQAAGNSNPYLSIARLVMGLLMALELSPLLAKLFGQDFPTYRRLAAGEKVVGWYEDTPELEFHR